MEGEREEDADSNGDLDDEVAAAEAGGRLDVKGGLPVYSVAPPSSSSRGGSPTPISTSPEPQYFREELLEKYNISSNLKERKKIDEVI